jgi:hypothetical protein
MLPTNDDVSNSIQLLAAIVREFHSVGRPCLGATLKPELFRRTQGSFNEQRLGFLRFGDFLRSAAAAGLVQLRPTPGGDIAVWPMGVVAPVAPQPTFAQSSPLRFEQTQTVSAPPVWVAPQSVAAPTRVRQDLWNAFNSYSASWVYDPTADLAYREADGRERAAGESPLVKIPPGRERVTEWMRSFAKMQDVPTQEKLTASFEGPSGPYGFHGLVRRDLRLQRMWHRFHVQQVLASIDAWASANSLHPKNLTGTGYWAPTPVSPAAAQVPQVPERVPPQVTTAAQPSQLILSTQLESLIDELIDGLVKLRGFLQIVRPSQ